MRELELFTCPNCGLTNRVGWNVGQTSRVVACIHCARTDFPAATEANPLLGVVVKVDGADVRVKVDEHGNPQQDGRAVEKGRRFTVTKGTGEGTEQGE